MRVDINAKNLKNDVNILFMDGTNQPGVLYFPQIIPVNHYSMEQMIVGKEAEIMAFTHMNGNQVHHKLDILISLDIFRF